MVVAANDAAPTQRRIPMARLTDTQLVILSAASQRDDRGVESRQTSKAKPPERLSISSSAPACSWRRSRRAGGGNDRLD